MQGKLVTLENGVEHQQLPQAKQMIKRFLEGARFEALQNDVSVMKDRWDTVGAK